MNERIAIIGSGNMGGAIAHGLESKGIVDISDITLTNSTTNNNREAADNVGIIVLSVKPQKMKGVLQEIHNACEGKLIISVAAGVTMSSIAQNLDGEHHKIVRVMPNLGARVGESMSVWVANEYVTEEDKVQVRRMLGAIGKEIEIDSEDMIDAVTAISGSGPAYFFYFVEQLTFMGQQFGFSEETARALAEQTLIGAAKVLAFSEQTAQELRLAVTSQGGTTYAATERFRTEMLDLRFQKGVRDAQRRAQELRIK